MKDHGILSLANFTVARLSTFWSRFTSEWKIWFASFFKKYKENLITFLWLTIVAIAIFGYTLISYNFTIPLSGDGYLQAQTMPYQLYDDWHNFFKNGHFDLWDTSSGLGVNTIGANSFYGMFSPFTIILLPFPRSWIPQEIAIEYILRLVLGGFFFYLYLQMFGLSPKIRRIGAVAFAFCGWATYYLWFAFYLDSFAFFPLILYGIEKVIQKKDPRLLIFAFFMEGLCNYFFFVVFMIGGFIYAGFRYFQCWKKMGTAENRWAVIGNGFIAFALGIMLSAFILLPGIMNAQAMPRVETSSYLTSLSEAWANKDIKSLLSIIFQFDYTSGTASYKRVYPLTGFVFMNLASFNNNLMQVSYYDNMSGSSYIFVPMILMTFVGFFYAFKKKRISYIIGSIFTAMIIAIPFFYYMFSAFTVGYARHYLIPIAWMITFACITMQERDEISRSYLDAAIGLLVILQITAYCLAIWAINNQFSIRTNGYPFESNYWWERLLILPFQFGIDALCYVLMRRFFHGKRFSLMTLLLVSAEAIAMGNTVILNHGFGDIRSLESSGGRGMDIVSHETEINDKLEAYDSSIYRVYNSTVDRNNTNLGLTIGHNSLSAFNSNYAFQAQDFIDWSNMGYTSGNWSMGEHNRRPGIETFLGVKYYMVRHGYESNQYKKDTNIPWGYKNILDIDPSSVDEDKQQALKDLQDTIKSQQSDGVIGRDLYVNTNYIDFGFAFDNVISSSIMAEYGYTDANEYAYIRYAVMDEDDLADEDVQKLLSSMELPISTISYATKFTTSDKVTFTLNLVGNSYVGNVQIFDNTYDVAFEKTGDDTYVDEKYHLSFIKGTSSLKFTGFNKTDITISYKETNGVLTFSQNMSMLERQNNLTTTIYASHWDSNGKYITGDIGDSSIDHYIYPADTVINYDNPGLESIKGLKYYSKIVMEKKDGTCFAKNASVDNPMYISMVTPDHYEWHFVDEDGNDVTSGEECNSSYQKAHGFYVTKPVKRIIGYLFENKDETESITKPTIYVASYSDYLMAINELKENSINIEYRRSDKARFSTNYTKNKFVVLNQPYENGWTLKKWGYPLTTSGKEDTTKEKGWQDVTIYKSQGGFIGFIAEKGENLYQLQYKTPGLSIGSKATLLGFVLTAVVYISYSGKTFERIWEEERRLRCASNVYEKN